MASKIPQQSVFLYEGNWTAETDALMLRTIIRMKKNTMWEGTVIPPEFIREAADVIAAELDVKFSWEDIYGRFLFFERRFRSFKSLTRVPGVHWNVHTNEITAPEPVWNTVLKENSLASAYYYVAESEFQNLTILFGPNSIKLEKEETVIVISDSTVPLINLDDLVQPAKVFKHPTTEGSDSVSSPIVGTGSKLRRKLFDEDNPHNDRESTNQEELRQMRAPKPPKTPWTSPHGSSCASSSPHKWPKNPFK